MGAGLVKGSKNLKQLYLSPYLTPMAEILFPVSYWAKEYVIQFLHENICSCAKYNNFAEGLMPTHENFIHGLDGPKKCTY